MNPFLILPNLISLFNLLTGFLCMITAAYGNYRISAWLILLALFWDSLDGNVARMFKVISKIGRELDSLADIVSFVVAPAFLLGMMLIHKTNLWFIFLLFIYVSAGAYRLARFNVMPPVMKGYFQGLPTPAAAATFSALVLTHTAADSADERLFLIIIPATLFLFSVLMTSNIPYPKFSELKISEWKYYYSFSILLFIVSLFLFNFKIALLITFFAYVFITPFHHQSFFVALTQSSGNRIKRK